VRSQIFSRKHSLSLRIQEIVHFRTLIRSCFKHSCLWSISRCLFASKRIGLSAAGFLCRNRRLHCNSRFFALFNHCLRVGLSSCVWIRWLLITLSFVVNHVLELRNNGIQLIHSIQVNIYGTAWFLLIKEVSKPCRIISWLDYIGIKICLFALEGLWVFLVVILIVVLIILLVLIVLVIALVILIVVLIVVVVTLVILLLVVALVLVVVVLIV